MHANIVLLDEINRSSAKTQSAMLEAMQERQTSIGGTVYKLPEPFLVIATQNPIEQEGTYLLPEAQLDRFLLKECSTTPTPRTSSRSSARSTRACSTPAGAAPGSRSPTCCSCRTPPRRSSRRFDARLPGRRSCRPPANPRQSSRPTWRRLVEYGASPRASIAFLHAARALALLAGRAYVIPEDVKSLAHRVLRHRVVLTFEADALEIDSEQVIDAIVAAIPAP